MQRGILIVSLIAAASLAGCALTDRSDPRLGILLGLQQLRYSLPQELEERWRETYLEATQPPVAASGGVANDCDRYAADPRDPKRISPGVALLDMRPRLAVRVCAAAYRAAPRDVRYQYQLARGYLAAGDDTSALPMLQSAASAGYVRAQVALADVYLRQGQRLGLNTEPAVRLLEYAAENGSVDSMARLGLIYFQGSAIERDLDKSVMWLERAAEARHPVAMRALGKVLLRGAPVSENPKGDLREAFSLFEASAALGDGEGQHMLALMHGAGHGTERNRLRYVEWIAVAAKNGHPAAQAKLGAEYLGFDDLVQDYPKAYFWTAVAVQNGILEVRPILDFLAERMTPEELRELDRAAATWTLEAALPMGWDARTLAFAGIPAYETDDLRAGDNTSAPQAVVDTEIALPGTDGDQAEPTTGLSNGTNARDSSPDRASQPRSAAATPSRRDPVLFSDVDFPEARTAN